MRRHGAVGGALAGDYVVSAAGGWASVPLADIGVRPALMWCEHGVREVSLLADLVNVVVLARAVLPLHASAVEQDGVGAVFTGWAKGGKTESVLALVSRGASLVADEWAYVSRPVGGPPEVFGYPEAMHVWDWQLDQLPELTARLRPDERRRLTFARRMGAATRFLPAVVSSALTPAFERRRGLDVEPARLFGAGRCVASARVDRLILVESENRDDTVVEPADSAAVAGVMAWSLRYERRALTAHYQRFRYAFPDRANPVLDDVDARADELLHSALAGVRAWRVRHPYPVVLADLAAALAPLLGERP
jgi:hypothetical protein